MPIVPHRFLVRVMHACPYVAEMPRDGDESIVELPESARLDSFADLDETPDFADVRLGWNESGLGVVAVVRGKSNPPVGDIDKPKQSDGLTLWIDTRGDRTGHRATRTCHQFTFLPVGGGETKEEPGVVQLKIHRALQDAPLSSANDIPFRSTLFKGGYKIEAFLSGNVLGGYHPDEFPKLGVCYSVRDDELGEQSLVIDGDFPYWEDPSLWASLELKPKVG
jgi:hypothetical protein